MIMTPKRKVTDLLPSEAILISSYEERDAINDLITVERAWNNRKGAVNGFGKWLVIYPIYVNKTPSGKYFTWTYGTNRIKVPATDFIPTEAEKVEVDWKMIAEKLSAELEKVAEFFRTYNKPDNTFGSFVSKQIGFTEIAESVNQTLLKTRNSETK